jgi:hypothetical protein
MGLSNSGCQQKASEFQEAMSEASAGSRATTILWWSRDRHGRLNGICESRVVHPGVAEQVLAGKGRGIPEISSAGQSGNGGPAE